MLTNPVILVFAGVPLIVAGVICAGAYRRWRGRTDVSSKAARWALVPCWLSLLGWTLYVLQAIALSQKGTAVFGVITISSVGIPLANAIFAVAWALFVLVLSVRSRRRHERVQKWAVGVAAIVLLLASAFGASSAYSALLENRARTETSGAALRALRREWWVRTDVGVLTSLAGNPHTPPDVLTELASYDDHGVRSSVARNPGTPVATLTTLYDEPSNRYSLAVNPSTPRAMLQSLARDTDDAVRVNLLFNPSVPVDVLEAMQSDPQVGKLATATLRRRQEGPMWSIIAPPYTWTWLHPFTRVLDDGAPPEAWEGTPYRFRTRDECEVMRSELVRREKSPRRLAGIARSGREPEFPVDFYSHSRCGVR